MATALSPQSGARQVPSSICGPSRDRRTRISLTTPTPVPIFIFRPQSRKTGLMRSPMGTTAVTGKLPYSTEGGRSPGDRLPGQTVEELDFSRLQRVFRADDRQPFVADQLLEHIGAVAQVTDGDAHVGADRVAHQRLLVVAQIGLEQNLDGGAHAVDDRADVAGLILRRLPQLLQGRADGAALGVAEHDDQPGAEARGGELDTADL